MGVHQLRTRPPPHLRWRLLGDGVQLDVASEASRPAPDERATTTRGCADQPPRRLRVAELTGQTKPLSVQRQRQRLFKGAFLPAPARTQQATASTS